MTGASPSCCDTCRRARGRPSPTGDSAALVRGEDRYGHFEHEPVPARDLDPVAVAFHRKAEEQQRQIYFRGTAWQDTRVSHEGVTAPY